MSKTALIIVAEGTEDIELTVTSDVLRRANVHVTIASVEDKDFIKLSRELIINVDKKLKEIVSEKFDAIIIPGGPGHKKVADDKRVGEILKTHETDGKVLAAICAGPVVFKVHNIAHGATVTSYPSVAHEFKLPNYKYVEDNVVSYDNIITSRGPGTTFEFALKIVELLAGNEVASQVREKLLC